MDIELSSGKILSKLEKKNLLRQIFIDENNRDLEDMTQCDIQIFVSTPSDIRSSIEKFY